MIQTESSGRTFSCRAIPPGLRTTPQLRTETPKIDVRSELLAVRPSRAPPCAMV